MNGKNWPSGTQTICGCRFLCFFSICAIRNEVVFLLLEHSFQPLLQVICWKDFLKLKHLSFEIKKYIQPKPTEMEQNWIIFTPYGSIKNLWKIHPRDSHMCNSKEKNKVGKTTCKITWLDWSKTAKQISINSCRKFLCQYQASRWADKQALSLQFSFLRIFYTFQPSRLLF